MSEPIDPILTVAEAKRDEIAQELQKIKDWIAAYRLFKQEAGVGTRNTAGTVGSMAAFELPVDRVDAEAAREAEAPNAAPPPRVRVTDNPKPAVVVQAAIEVIRAEGRPMTRRAIHTALAERGLVVRGADPVKALGTMLWRTGANELVQLDGYGYWLADSPYPLAGFDPVMKGEAVNRAVAEIERELDLG